MQDNSPLFKKSAKLSSKVTSLRLGTMLTILFVT